MQEKGKIDGIAKRSQYTEGKIEWIEGSLECREKGKRGSRHSKSLVRYEVAVFVGRVYMMMMIHATKECTSTMQLSAGRLLHVHYMLQPMPLLTSL